MIPFERVSPIDLLKIHHEFQMNPSVARVSLHLRSEGQLTWDHLARLG